MSAVLWLPIGLLHVWWSGRYSGETGRERFDRLSERRAQAVHEIYASRLHDFLLVAAAATCLLGLLFALILNAYWAAVLWGADVVVLLLALLLRRRVRPLVLDAFRARQLPPLQRREYSARGHRRQKQFGVVALTSFLLAETARFFAELEGVPALLALAAAAMLVAFLSVFALLWSTAWVYGDEVKSD